MDLPWKSSPLSPQISARLTRIYAEASVAALSTLFKITDYQLDLYRASPTSTALREKA
jgi:hypothetical protein